MKNKKINYDKLENQLNKIYREFGLLNQFNFDGCCFVFSRVVADIVIYNEETERYTYKKKNCVQLNCVRESYGNIKTTEILLSIRKNKLYLLRNQQPFYDYYYSGKQIYTITDSIDKLYQKIDLAHKLKNTIDNGNKKIEKKPLKI